MTFLIIYLALSLGLVAMLSYMLLKIGKLIADCPQQGSPATRAAAVTVATGFATVGAGAIVLIGALLPLTQSLTVGAMVLALGFASLCLGLGFAQAAAILRDVGTQPRDAEKRSSDGARAFDAAPI